MNKEIQNQQIARHDPAQQNILVWSVLDSYLEETPKRGKKCPMFTF